jgi:hypothetical protein
VRYSAKQVDEMNACWNSVFRRIFGFHDYESVKGFTCGLGRLYIDLRHILGIRRINFTDHQLPNETVWINLTNHSDDEDLINSVFTNIHVTCYEI